MAKDLLLEIGTEEIPAGFMEKALADLEKLTTATLKEQRINWGELKVYGTPRRLALLITNLAESQSDLEEEVKGPSKKVGLDDQGNYTKAAQGFAKGQGVVTQDLFVKELNGVEYLYALKKAEGKETVKLLPELLPSIITSLNFPKSMRWGDYDLRFVRPIRWLIALYGQEVIDFTITDIKTDRLTFGHRFLAKEPLTVAEPSQYLAILEQGHVIGDQEKRRQIIWQQILDLAAAEGGRVDEDAELLEEVNYLVELPTALCGSFAEQYLELPVEVLITPMREHQRYFPLYNQEGKLMNKFITVRNGNSDFIDTVRQGNEKVLAARLADARFFYQEDLQKTLEQLVPQLAQITFQESLGTVLDKVERVGGLTQHLGERIGTSAQELQHALVVAKLAKADLVTNMVYEFPELQGIMGSYYAAAKGEKPEISQGIREHYYPRFAGDKLPQGMPGWLVSVADKLDTIVGCFGVGIQPTGSQDPYGLRRQALAVCNLLLQRECEIPIEELLAAAYANLDKKIKLQLTKEELVSEVTEFFLQRMKNILGEQGHRYDVVEAVLAPGNTNMPSVVNWAQALTSFRQDQGFIDLLTGFNRVTNLAKKGPGGVVNPKLLQEPAEIELKEAVDKVAKLVEQSLADKQYLQALQQLAQLQQPIDQFFTDIMVMVDNQELKDNRLALLNSITQLVDTNVNLTKIVID